MTIDQAPTIQPSQGRDGLQRRAETPEEAARQFEAILVRQFVATMTDGLFKNSLASDEGPGWMKGQQQTQRDVLTDVLTKHLTESKALRISELLVRRWQATRAAELPPDPEQEAAKKL